MRFLSTRRRFLGGLVRASSVLIAAQLPRAASGLQHTPKPLQSPNAPTNQNAPAGLNQYPEGSPPRPYGAGYSGIQLHDMVERLYQMTLDLKQEADRTNLRNILPVDFGKKAHSIEKLAKDIRHYAGS